MPVQTRKNKKTIKKTLDYLKQKSADTPNLKVFFFDEARFGLQTSLARVWSLSGKPLQIKVKQGYQNFYIYGSVDIKTGDNYSLLLPWVNTEIMNLYLDNMSQEYPDHQLVIIMDQAGWHKSKDLVLPKNIEIIFLPPYSPELNPIERLWKLLKTRFIHNRVFDSLKDIMSCMAEAVGALDPAEIARLCSCNYLDL